MHAIENVHEGFNFLPMPTGEPVRTASPDRIREFNDILSRDLPKFRRIAMGMLRNSEDAEDAVQDAMLLGFRYMARFDGRSQMSTWLTSILLNAVRMQIRKRPRGKAFSIDQSLEDGQTSISEMLADYKPTPERVVEQGELHKLVCELAGQLPHTQQAALWLRFQDELSLEETADRLGVAVGTIKARTARAKAKLTERFHRATAKRKEGVNWHRLRPV